MVTSSWLSMEVCIFGNSLADVFHAFCFWVDFVCSRHLSWTVKLLIWWSFMRQIGIGCDRSLFFCKWSPEWGCWEDAIKYVWITARTCTAILCNSWSKTFAAKVPALWTVCTTFPKLARNISIQWPHPWLTTIYTRSWAALRGWDPPPYDRSSVFSDPWFDCCSLK